MKMLAFANIRKSKNNTVTLLIMFIVAGLLLNAGLLVLFNYSGNYSKMTEDLNSSDMYCAIPSSGYSSQIKEYLDGNDNITEYEMRNARWCLADIKFRDEIREEYFLFYDADEQITMSKWKTAGETLPVRDMELPAYIPITYKLSGGYELGDRFELKLPERSVNLTIAGFTQDSYFNVRSMMLMGIYLPHETYREVSGMLPEDSETQLVFANMKKPDSEILTHVREITKLNDALVTKQFKNSVMGIDLAMVDQGRTMMADIMSIMIVVFSLIVMTVCLIVVRFRIKNSIEEDMQKTGSLKSVGYTSNQIISSVVLQFSFIAFLGTITGILLSYLTIPFISGLFAEQSGVLWEQGFDAGIGLFTVVFFLLAVMIVSLIAAKRMKRISPITALRGGILTHNFRKNFIPLDKARGRLPLVLALKSTVQNAKQSIMICIILTAVAFSSTFAVVMFYNSVIDTSTFAKVPGSELSNAQMVLYPDRDNTDLVNKIGNMSEVKKTAFLDYVTMKSDRTIVSVGVMEDYEKKETNLVYEGRNPQHGNEIAIGGHFAEAVEKEIGDSIVMTYQDKKVEYLITGLTQGVNLNGMVAWLTTDGYKKTDPQFQHITLEIYLEEGIGAAGFIKNLEKEFEGQYRNLMDIDLLFEEGMSSYQSIVSQIGIIMMAAMAFIVILVLYFVINSSIIQRKRELGIQKAIGYTTFQLMNQITIGFMPSIITGVTIGSILGILSTNPLMSVGMRAAGTMKAEFIIEPGLIILFSGIIVLTSYVTSMAITYRIRKISAYTLVSE